MLTIVAYSNKEQHRRCLFPSQLQDCINEGGKSFTTCTEPGLTDREKISFHPEANPDHFPSDCKTCLDKNHKWCYGCNF